VGEGAAHANQLLRPGSAHRLFEPVLDRGGGLLDRALDRQLHGHRRGRAAVAAALQAQPHHALLVDAEELDRRRANWKPLQPRYTTGVLAKYARLVTGADRGAITEP
jgi:hypothetical protein